MPNWNEVLKEIQLQGSQSPLDTVRRKYLKQLFDHTGRNVIAYYSGFLSKPGIMLLDINDEDMNGFMMAVHRLDREKGFRPDTSYPRWQHRLHGVNRSLPPSDVRKGHPRDRPAGCDVCGDHGCLLGA